MSGRCRRNGISREQRIYRWALGRGEFRVADAESELGLRYWQAVKALDRLCQKGSMKRLGANHWHRRYVATDREPDDLRGTAPSSLDALRLGMFTVRRAAPRRMPRPQLTALEQHWGRP